MYVPEIPDGVVLLTVDNNYRTLGDYYAAARSAWRVDRNRVEDADYIVAVTDEVIREVFVANRWYFVPSGRLGRYAFDGRIAGEEVRNFYVDMPVPDRLRRVRGARNPVRYANC